MPRAPERARPVTRLKRPPRADNDWAWFFDLDGTLVDIAATPSGIVVTDDLQHLIARLRDITGGAVSLITGRAVSDVERFLPVPGLVIAGQHGLELRKSWGHTDGEEVDADFEAIEKTLSMITSRHPGLVAEHKGKSVALHYRRAPELAGYAHRTMRDLLARYGPGLVLQKGKRVVELRPKGADKGVAITSLMKHAPFRNRTPVFVGDDLTDEAGFAVVNNLGGHSVKVGPGRTAARWRLRDADDVRRWLLSSIEHIDAK